MAWNVLVSPRINDTGPQSITDMANLLYVSDSEKIEENELNDIDGIILSGRDIPADFLEKAKNLKVISKFGVGLDTVDIEAATSQGIIVCNAPGSNAQAVAEHTIGLLLAARKQLHTANNDLRNNEWNQGDYTAPELRGDVLGLYGCGNIGEKVVQFARPFGLRCITYDPYLNEYDVPPGVSTVDSMDELFMKSDIVSIHVPLTESTFHSVSHEELEALPDSGILINTARGEVVDEDALIDALRQQNILGAGIDVFSEEPIENNKLLTLDSLIATPHIGGATIESNREKSIRSAENIRAVYEGNIPSTTVNINGFFDLPR